MVFPADDVCHLHFNVVHHVDEVEDVGAVRAADGHVRRVGGVPVVDGDVAADHVVERNGLGAVKAEAPCAVVLIDAPGVLELFEIGVVNVVALALEIGAAVAAFHGAFVPVQAQPFHAGEDRAGGFLRVASRVRILNAENEGAPHLAGEQPVEQGGARTADVKITRGRRRESCSDVTHDALESKSLPPRVKQIQGLHAKKGTWTVGTERGMFSGFFLGRCRPCGLRGTAF